MPFAGAVVPRGWAQCNGQLLPIQQWAALFSLLGTYYGGNGTTNFALPDLRGRAILGSTGGGGNYPVGVIAGTTTVTLTTPQLPSHSHILQASKTAGSGRGSQPAGNLFGQNTDAVQKLLFAPPSGADTPLQIATNITSIGGNGSHNNLQPYLVISYLIALSGTYPSRS